MSDWYARNRERLLPIRKAYNAKYFSDPAKRELRRQLANKPEQKEKRRLYKLTPEGKAAEKRYREAHKEQIRTRSAIHRLRRYGLTHEAVQALLREQSSLCRICLKDISLKFHIDHCHKNNHVRGLLCTACNMGLGLFKDDVGLLQRAITYICRNTNPPQH